MQRSAAQPRGRTAGPMIDPDDTQPIVEKAGDVYSCIVSPEPPNAAGKSRSFGKPSRIGSTVSA